MNLPPELTPTFQTTDNTTFPVIDPMELWKLKPAYFNEWRRHYDFPRIVRFLKENLQKFDEWQKEQGLSDEDLIFFGPARFLKFNSGKVKIVLFEKENMEDPKRIIEDEKLFKSLVNNEHFYGSFKIQKEVTPYYNWAKIKKIIPSNLEHSAFVLSVDSKSYNSKTKDVEAFVMRKLKLLHLGGLTLEYGAYLGGGGWNIENKNFEFICLDYLHLLNFRAGGSMRLDFGSAERMKIENSGFSVSAYKTSFGGLSVENSSLSHWSLKECNVKSIEGKGLISNSQLHSWKLINTPFVQHYSSLKVLDSTFAYKKDKEEEFRNIRHMYSTQGDFKNSGRYYYLEKLANIYSKLNFFTYLKDQLPLPRNARFSHNFTSNFYKFKSKEVNNFKASLDFLQLLFFRIKTLLTPKYFILLIKHYFTLTVQILDFLIRGFGEKPFRIVLTSICLILFFVLVDMMILEDFDSKNLIFHNVLNFIGRYDLENLEDKQIVFKIFETLCGIFLISLFVADYSSKRKY
ncbi:hypothetical protein [Salinimicrobium terrae]|uniref:hypothetical protein n=1 Tax=Salinimicrobium terrae TaxID=470866 RepID=UPI0003F4BA4A|nr:hypothetical protein [Salinimicrobium terrae]